VLTIYQLNNKIIRTSASSQLKTPTVSPQWSEGAFSSLRFRQTIIPFFTNRKANPMRTLTPLNVCQHARFQKYDSLRIKHYSKCNRPSFSHINNKTQSLQQGCKTYAKVKLNKPSRSKNTLSEKTARLHFLAMPVHLARQPPTVRNTVNVSHNVVFADDITISKNSLHSDDNRYIQPDI
jgi:hypothetical protein